MRVIKNFLIKASFCRLIIMHLNCSPVALGVSADRALANKEPFANCQKLAKKIGKKTRSTLDDDGAPVKDATFG